MNVKLNRFSFGVGDRFAHQAKAQLTAIQKAKESGITITQFGINHTGNIPPLAVSLW